MDFAYIDSIHTILLALEWTLVYSACCATTYHIPYRIDYLSTLISSPLRTLVFHSRSSLVTDPSGSFIYHNYVVRSPQFVPIRACTEYIDCVLPHRPQSHARSLALTSQTHSLRQLLPDRTTESKAERMRTGKCSMILGLFGVLYPDVFVLGTH